MCYQHAALTLPGRSKPVLSLWGARGFQKWGRRLIGGAGGGAMVGGGATCAEPAPDPNRCLPSQALGLGGQGLHAVLEAAVEFSPTLVFRPFRMLEPDPWHAHNANPLHTRYTFRPHAGLPLARGSTMKPAEDWGLPVPWRGAWAVWRSVAVAKPLGPWPRILRASHPTGRARAAMSAAISVCALAGDCALTVAV